MSKQSKQSKQSTPLYGNSASQVVIEPTLPSQPVAVAGSRLKAEEYLAAAAKFELEDEDAYERYLQKALDECADIKPAVKASLKEHFGELADDHFDLPKEECASFYKQCLHSLSTAGYKTSSASKKSLYDDAFSKRRAETFLSEAEKYDAELVVDEVSTWVNNEKCRNYLQKALGSGWAELDSQAKSLQNKRVERFLSLAENCDFYEDKDEKLYEIYLKEALAEGAEAQPRVDEIRKGRAALFLSLAEEYAEKGDIKRCNVKLQNAIDECGRLSSQVEKTQAEMYLALASKWSLAYDGQYQKNLSKALNLCADVAPQAEAVRKARAEMHLAVAKKCTLDEEDKYQNSLKKALEECTKVRAKVDDLRRDRAALFLSLAEDYAEKGDIKRCNVKLQNAIDECGRLSSQVEKAQAEIYLALAPKLSLAYDEQYQDCLMLALIACPEVEPAVKVIRKARAEMHLAVAKKCRLDKEISYQNSLKKALAECADADVKSEVSAIRKARAEMYLAVAKECELTSAQETSYQESLSKALAECADADVKSKVKVIRKARAEMHLAVAKKCTLNEEDKYQNSLKKASAECADADVKSEVSAIRKARAEMYLAVAKECELTSAQETSYQASLSKALAECADADVKSKIETIRKARAEKHFVMADSMAQSGTNRQIISKRLQQALNEHTSIKPKVDRLKQVIELYDGLFVAIDNAISAEQYSSIYALIEPLKDGQSNFSRWAIQKAKNYAVSALLTEEAALALRQRELEQYL